MREGEVHVWVTRTSVGPAEFARCWAVLDGEERARADRFHMPVHRSRFVASRAFLRTLLSRYTGMPPASIWFVTSAHGKPALVDPSGPHFNLSHSHEAAACVVAAVPVGVDVEHVRPMPDAMHIAERFFAPEERAALARVPPHRRQEAFFTCWCRKEAYVKATGHGLSLPLDRFAVSVEPEVPVIGGWGTEGWSIRNVTAGEGYVGSVAIASLRPEVIQCAWVG